LRSPRRLGRGRSNCFRTRPEWAPVILGATGATGANGCDGCTPGATRGARAKVTYPPGLDGCRPMRRR
jgi:hypothetical protein